MCDCYLLVMNRHTFMTIMSEFEDFREEVLAVAKEREKIRIKKEI